MTMNKVAASESRSPQIAAQIAAFRTDPPIHVNFPLKLNNGAVVPAFTARCGHCRQQIDPDWIHGRVFDSLPTVKTLDANAYCRPCARFFHYDVRFRAANDSVQMECANGRGGWSTFRQKPNSPMHTLKQCGRKLVAKVRSLFGDKG